MGMYDYMGGEQIKCFPLAFVDSEDNKFNLRCIDGDFRGYRKGDRVPYQTLYYNYGKDFLIFDYMAALVEEDDIYVHIVEKGKYVKTIKYNKLPKNYNIKKVVNKNGKELNINSSADLSLFITELSNNIKKDRELTEYYNKEFGVKGYNIRELKEKSVSSEEFMADLDKRKKIFDIVCEETTRPFSKKWYVEEELEENLLVGYLLHCYIKSEKSDSDWNNIFDSFIKYLEENNYTYFDLLDKYMSWVRENNIMLNTDKLEELNDKVMSRGV